MKKLLTDYLGFHLLPFSFYQFGSFGCPDSRSGFRILHSAFFILPSLRSASPSAPCNHNLDPERCVSVSTLNPITYQMSHSETFDNPLGHSMFQNPLLLTPISTLLAAKCPASQGRRPRLPVGPASSRAFVFDHPGLPES